MGNPSRRNRVVLRVASLTAASLFAPLVAYANPVGTWIGTGSDLWTNSGRWTPVRPFDEFTDAVFPATGQAAYTVALNWTQENIYAPSLRLGAVTLADPAVTVRDKAQYLTIVGGLNVQQGTFEFVGGTMSDTAVTVSPAATFVVPTGADYGYGPQLRNVTFGGNMRVETMLDVRDQLTLSNSVITLAPNGGITGISSAGPAGGLSITGTATITTSPNNGGQYVQNTIQSFNSDLTIGPGVTVKPVSNTSFYIAANRVNNYGTLDATASASGFNVRSLINYGVVKAAQSPSSLVLTDLDNRGTITVSNGATLSLFGNWSNGGTITATNAYMVSLDGHFTTASAMGIVRTNTPMTISGTMDNTGATVSIDALNNGNWPFNQQYTAVNGAWVTVPAVVKGGTVTTGAAGGFVIPARGAGAILNNTPGPTVMFDGVTLAVDTSVGAGANLQVANGLNLAGNATVTLAGTTAAPPYGTTEVATLTMTGTGALSGTGTIAFGGGSVNPSVNQISATGGLTIGPGITVKTGSGSGTIGGPSTTLVNQGTISAQGAGRSVVIPALAWTNQGTVEAVNSGSLVIAGTVQSTPASVYRAASGGTLTVYGNVVIGGGTIDSAGGTVTLAPAPSPNPTSAGTITGGTLSGASLHVAASATAPGSVGGVLDGVTLAGSVTVDSQATLQLRNAFTLQGGSISLNNTSAASGGPVARLVLQSPLDTLVGSGEVTFTGSAAGGVATSVVASDGPNLTVGPGITVRTAGTDGTVGLPGNTLVNRGTLSAQTPSRTLSVGASAVTNEGTIEAAGGTMSMNGTWSNVGTFRSANAGSLLSVTGTGVNAGTISPSLSGAISIGGSWTNPGVISVGSGTVTLAGTWSNTGTISQTGGTLNLDGNWSNPGTLTITGGGTLNLGGSFATAELDHVVRSAGTVNVTGTVNNAGATLNVGPALGSINLTGAGKITGGTVTRTGTANLTFYGGSSLDGVTLDSDFALGTGAVTVANGLTLANGHALAFSGSGATLQFAGSQALGGTGQVLFSGTASSNVLSAGTGNATIGPGITVTGTRGGTITAAAGASVLNQGTIWSQTAGETISLGGAWSNTGTLKVTAGTLNLGGTFSASSLDNVVQTGGTLVIGGAVDNVGHTLTFQGPTTFAAGGSITGGTIHASGPSAAITVASLPLGGGGGGNFTLDGVTLGADVTVPGSMVVTFANSPKLANSRILVPSSIQGTILAFPGDQTLGGTGQIFLDGTSNTEAIMASGGTLTLGPGITVATGRATTGLVNFVGDVVNQGTVVAGASHPVYAGSASGGTFANAGSIQVDAGGLFSFWGAVGSNGGAVSVAPGGTLSIGSTTSTNTGTITANNASVTFAGAWTNAGTVTVNGGTLVLAGTSAQSGTINAAGAAVTLAGPTPSTGSFVDSAVTAVVPYTTAQLAAVPVSGASASIAIGAGGVLDNTSATWTLSAAAPPLRLAGGSITGGTIGSPDGTALAAVSGSSTLSNLTLNAPSSVAPSAVLTLNNVTNNATVTVSAGATLAVQSGAAGTVTAGPGSTVSLAAPVSSLASATLDGATFVLKSAATTAELRSLTATGTEFAIGAGGTLTNTGDDLHASQASNTWSLAGGTLSGGTIGTPITAKAGSGTSTITGGITVASDLSVANGAALSATGALTLGPTGTVRFLGTGTVTVATGSSLSGTGQVVFDGPGAAGTAVFRGNSPLVVPAGMTVKTGLGSGTLGSLSFALTNQGLVSAQTPGQSLTILGTNWTNTGTLEATNNSTLFLGGTFSRTAMGTISTSNGGVAAITGSLNNTGTLTISAASAIGVGPGGSVTGGTIASADGTPFYAYGGGTASAGLTFVTISAPVNLLPGSIVRFSSNTTSSGAVTGSGASLTIGAGATNAGSISLTNGSTLTFDVGGNPTGTISLADSTLAFNNIVSTSILKKFTRSNTTAQFASTLTNTNDTLAASDEVGSVRLTGTNASIQGGTVTTSGAARLYIAGTNKLNGVTMQGGITVQSGGILQIDTLGLTPVNASVSLAAGASTATFQIPGGTTLAPAPGVGAPAGTGVIDVSFDGTSSLGVLAPQTLSSVVTLGPGVTVHTGTQGGTLGVNNASLTSTGTISAQTPGKLLTVVGTFRNNNLVEVKNGGAIRFATIYSQAAGGLVKVYPDSTLISVPAVTTTGRTDLAGGNLIYDYTSTSLATSLRNQLKTARATAGDWSATTGLTCSVAAGDPRHITAVGYAESATLLGLTGTQTGTWAGQTVDATAILARVTYYGDANLDGVVNGDDYALLDRGLAKGLTGWTNGDFDYDGAVTLADFLLIDKTFVTLSNPAAAAGLLAAREARFGPEYAAALVASVPEPSTLVLAAALPLMGRRRRASRQA